MSSVTGVSRRPKGHGSNAVYLNGNVPKEV